MVVGCSRLCLLNSRISQPGKAMAAAKYKYWGDRVGTRSRVDFESIGEATAWNCH